MLIKRFATILGLCLLCGSPALWAQSEDDEEKHASINDEGFGLSFVPQHLIKQGFRVDMEYFLKNSKSSLVLAPLYYGGRLDNDVDGTPDDELFGFGAELLHKVYLSNLEEVTETSIYLAHGPFARRFQVDYQVESWLRQEQGNITTFEKGFREETRTINKFGYSFLFGFTIAAQEGLLMDFYFGGGIRATNTSSTQNNPAKPDRSFKNSIIDYGHEGAVPIVGLKIGAYL